MLICHFNSFCDLLLTYSVYKQKKKHILASDKYALFQRKHYIIHWEIMHCLYTVSHSTLIYEIKTVQRNSKNFPGHFFLGSVHYLLA